MPSIYLGVISRDVDQDAAAALAWWWKAAELRTIHAPYEIGNLYRSGQLSGPESLVKALVWIMVGVEFDDDRASQASDQTAASLTTAEKARARL